MNPNDTTLLALASGVLIPLAVGLITKLAAPAGLKAILNAGLSALAGLLATMVPGAFSWRPFLTAWATTWVVSIATHYGLWKPTGIGPAVAQSTATVGVG